MFSEEIYYYWSLNKIYIYLSEKCDQIVGKTSFVFA